MDQRGGGEAGALEERPGRIMKKRLFALGCAIAVTGTLILGVGVYLKYWVLWPLGLAQDQEAAKVPFLWIADASLRDSVEEARQAAALAAQARRDAVFEDITGPKTGAIPETTEATQPPAEETAAPTEPTEPTEAAPVEESWYDDVLFIGDSRTEGLRNIARQGSADYFCTVGLSLHTYSNVTTFDDGFTRRKLSALLETKTYGKVIVALGINDCSDSVALFESAYADLVAMLREYQPDAVVILQGILTVGEYKSNSAECFHLDKIYALNEAMAALADGETVFYIDPNERFADERGYLPDEMSDDGCHLYAKYYPDFAQWMSFAVAQLGI